MALSLSAAALLSGAISGGMSMAGGIMQNRAARKAHEMESDLQQRAEGLQDEERDWSNRMADQQFEVTKEQQEFDLGIAREDQAQRQTDFEGDVRQDVLNRGVQRQFGKADKIQSDLLRRRM